MHLYEVKKEINSLNENIAIIKWYFQPKWLSLPVPVYCRFEDK